MKSERDTNKFLGFSKISKTHLFELHFTSNNTKVSIKTETGSHLIYSTFLVTPLQLLFRQINKLLLGV